MINENPMTLPGVGWDPLYAGPMRRLVRGVRILARDGRIPRPLRGLAAFGLLPLPGPIDEAALAIVGAVLWLWYRDRLRAAWLEAGQ